MIGPLAGGMLVDHYGMMMLFIVMIGLFVISIFTTMVYDHNLKGKNSTVEHNIGV